MEDKLQDKFLSISGDATGQETSNGHITLRPLQLSFTHGRRKETATWLLLM